MKTCNFAGQCQYKTTGTSAGCNLTSPCTYQAPQETATYSIGYYNQGETLLSQILEELKRLNSSIDRLATFGKG